MLQSSESCMCPVRFRRTVEMGHLFLLEKYFSTFKMWCFLHCASNPGWALAENEEGRVGRLVTRCGMGVWVAIPGNFFDGSKHWLGAGQTDREREPACWIFSCRSWTWASKFQRRSSGPRNLIPVTCSASSFAAPWGNMSGYFKPPSLTLVYVGAQVGANGRGGGWPSG